MNPHNIIFFLQDSRKRVFPQDTKKDPEIAENLRRIQQAHSIKFLRYFYTKILLKIYYVLPYLAMPICL